MKISKNYHHGLLEFGIKTTLRSTTLFQFISYKYTNMNFNSFINAQNHKKDLLNSHSSQTIAQNNINFYFNTLYRVPATQSILYFYYTQYTNPFIHPSQQGTRLYYLDSFFITCSIISLCIPLSYLNRPNATSTLNPYSSKT